MFIAVLFTQLTFGWSCWSVFTSRVSHITRRSISNKLYGPLALPIPLFCSAPASLPCGSVLLIKHRAIKTGPLFLYSFLTPFDYLKFLGSKYESRKYSLGQDIEKSSLVLLAMLEYFNFGNCLTKYGEREWDSILVSV